MLATFGVQSRPEAFEAWCRTWIDIWALSEGCARDVVQFAVDRDIKNLCSVVKELRNYEDHHAYPAIVQPILVQCAVCPTDEEFKARLRLNPLYDYAARNWGYHARAASAEMEQSAVDFLESESEISGSSHAMMASGRYPGYSQDVPRHMTGVHLAAYFGLRETMIALVKNGHDPNFKDTYGRTPLSWAAEKGHEAVVKLILEREGIDPDSKDIYGRTPLSWAAEKGHEAVVSYCWSTKVFIWTPRTI